MGWTRPPSPAGTSQTRVAAPEARSAATGDRALVGKRARTRQDRRQDRRQDTQRERGKDRKQAERKQNDKQKNRSRIAHGTSSSPLSFPAAASQAQRWWMGPRGNRSARKIATSCILDDDTGDVTRATTDIAAESAGVIPTHVYENVFEGFAAVIPDDQLAAVESDPRVEAVVPDWVVHVYEQTLPTGVDRIDADANSTADIEAAASRLTSMSP